MRSEAAATYRKLSNNVKQQQKQSHCPTKKEYSKHVINVETTTKIITLSDQRGILQTCNQAAISWRASDDRQISLSASAERAFANFRDKKTSYFTMANFRNKNNACPSVGSPAQAL